MEMQNGTRQLGGKWRGGREVEICRWRQTVVWALGMRQRGGAGQAGAGEVEICRWRQTAVWALGMRQRGGAGQAGAEALAGTGDAATGQM